MEHFIDIYNKKPELCEKLLSSHLMKINLKVDGKPFQVMNEEGTMSFHGRSGDETHVGPVIDDYTRLFSKPVNDAINMVESNIDAYKDYKFLTFEVIGDKMLLTAVVDEGYNFIDDKKTIDEIAEKLGTDTMPTLWEGALDESQIDSIVNILSEGNVPTEGAFIDWVKEQFGSYESFPENLISASPDFIEGIVFFFDVADESGKHKIVEYKIVDPAYRKFMEDRKNENAEEFGKNKSIYESIYNMFLEFAENTEWNKNEDKLVNLQENFMEMMSSPQVYNKLMNLGSKVRLNESKTYTVQVDRLTPQMQKAVRKNGNVYKQLFENFTKLFYKEKKRGYVISKDFQNKVNDIINGKS